MQLSSKPDLLAAAQGYASCGWAVFPLVPGQKRPLTDHGFKDATTDSAKISRWWKKYPDANIGVATGNISGLIVVDIDDPRSTAALRKLTGNTVTRTSQTQSGGWHLFFKHPGIELGNRTKFLPGIDLRGDGGYVVAPPSIINRRRYKFLGTDPIADLPAKLLAELKPTNNKKTKRAAPIKSYSRAARETETIYFEIRPLSNSEIIQNLLSGFRMALEQAAPAIPADTRDAMQIAALLKLCNGSTFQQAIKASTRVLLAAHSR